MITMALTTVVLLLSIALNIATYFNLLLLCKRLRRYVRALLLGQRRMYPYIFVPPIDSDNICAGKQYNFIKHIPTELQLRIMEYSSVPDLRLFASTCKFYYRLVQHHLPRRADEMFRAFDLNPSLMCDTLQQTQSVVSGSCALLVILPWSFTPNDMDIYVPSVHAPRLLHLLSTRFGYVLDDDSTDYPGTVGMIAVYTLSNGHRFIQVISTISENPLKSLYKFHSTIVMNFVSARGICCAYPRLTSQRRGLKNRYAITSSPQPSVLILACFDKYQRRGFDLAVNLSRWPEYRGHVCGVCGSCPYTDRCLADKHELFIPFDGVENMKRPSLAYNADLDQPLWSLVRCVTHEY